MIKEAIATGATVDEAKENAIQQLGADWKDDLQFEILDFPKKKVLGILGGAPAKVRVYVELPDPKPAKAAKPAKAPKADKPVEKAEKPAKKEKETVAPAKVEDPTVYTPAAQIDPTSPAGRACAYLADILGKLGCKALEIGVAQVEGGCKMSLSGEGLGVAIGRRGETLDALQYLSSLAANSKENGYYRVVINIGDYREKREVTLRGVAKRMAGQVLRTGRSRSLEPMNPYERRIIHTAIQEIEGVTSNSIGEGSSRRVVISPEGGQRPYSNDRRDRSRGPRRSAASAAPQADDRPARSDAGDLPLYGKIK